MDDRRQPVDSPAVGRSVDIVDPSEWTVTLTDAERAEITAATAAADAAGATIESIDRS